MRCVTSNKTFGLGADAEPRSFNTTLPTASTTFCVFCVDCAFNILGYSYHAWHHGHSSTLSVRPMAQCWCILDASLLVDVCVHVTASRRVTASLVHLITARHSCSVCSRSIQVNESHDLLQKVTVTSYWKSHRSEFITITLRSIPRFTRPISYFTL